MRFFIAKNFFLSFVIAAALGLVPVMAGAQYGNTVPTSGGFGNTVPTSDGYGNSVPTANQYSVQNPLTVTSVCGLFKKLFEAIVAIGIPVAVVFIIWAGFKFVLAQGSETKLNDAKKNLMYTLGGIAIFLGAWLIVTIIAATLQQLGVTSIASCT